MTIDFEYRGYRIRQASATGGKAGKGHNRTSSISVTPVNFPAHGGTYKSTVIRFNVFNPVGLAKAAVKARNWVDEVDAREAAELTATGVKLEAK